MRAPRWKNLTVNLGVLVGATIAGLLLAEILVRLFFPQQLTVYREDIWRPANGFGHRHREDANTVVNVGEGRVHFLSDENGWRVCRGRAVEHADKRILALGDSFLESLTVEAESTMVEVLRRKIAAKTGIHVQIDNTGVSGWNPNHYLMEARAALAQRHYDLGIVFIYVSNDIVTKEVASYPPRAFSERKHIRIPRHWNGAEWSNAVLAPTSDFLSAHSQFFVLLKRALRTRMAALGLRPMYFPVVFDKDVARSGRWETTARVCRRIADEFADRNIPVVFVLLPSHYQVDEETFRRYLDFAKLDPAAVDLEQPNKMLASAFASRGMVLCDPLPFLRRRAALGERLYGRVNKHFVEGGHRAVADFLYPLVVERLGLEGSGAPTGSGL